jgi:hypothetical protein
MKIVQESIEHTSAPESSSLRRSEDNEDDPEPFEMDIESDERLTNRKRHSNVV